MHSDNNTYIQPTHIIVTYKTNKQINSHNIHSSDIYQK